MRTLHRLLGAAVAALLMVVIGMRGGTSRRVLTPPAALRTLIVELWAMRLLVWFPLVILLFQLTERAILARDAVRRRYAGGRRRGSRGAGRDRPAQSEAAGSPDRRS